MDVAQRFIFFQREESEEGDGSRLRLGPPRRISKIGVLVRTSFKNGDNSTSNTFQKIINNVSKTFPKTWSTNNNFWAVGLQVLSCSSPGFELTIRTYTHMCIYIYTRRQVLPEEGVSTLFLLVACFVCVCARVRVCADTLQHRIYIYIYIYIYMYVKPECAFELGVCKYFLTGCLFASVFVCVCVCVCARVCIYTCVLDLSVHLSSVSATVFLLVACFVC